MNMPKFFGTSGIRGNIRDKVTPKLALKLGLNISSYLKSTGTIAIGYDNRTSSIMLEKAIISGIISGGCNATLLGLTPLPVLAYGTKKINAETGIMITASHNPAYDNGFKLFGSQGLEYPPVEEEIIENGLNLNSSIKQYSDKIGAIKTFTEVSKEYIDSILDITPTVNRKIKVVIDCANGAASNITPRILSKLGCRVLSLNTNIDGYFPGRSPEPSQENLTYLMKIVKYSGANIGLAHDCDADRVAVIDENGDLVVNDRIIALFAKKKLQEHGFGTIVTSIDTSTCIDDVVIPLNGKIKRVSLGQTHTHFKENQVILAAEPWKIIDPLWGAWADGIYTASRLVSMLDKNGPNLNDLLKDIPNYPQIRLSFFCPESIKYKVMKIAIANPPANDDICSIWTFDGVRINYSDGSWMLFRASGTEPKIRLYCEAKSTRKVKQLANKGTAFITNSISSLKKPTEGARDGI